jgi:TATA-box binding protein (TBP) (component of TFIID and TFIIIB)
MNTASDYHWKNIQRYIIQIPNNPFLRELKEDLWDELQNQQRRWILSQLQKLELDEVTSAWLNGLSTIAMEWIAEHIDNKEDMMNLYHKIEEQKQMNPSRVYDDIIDDIDEYTDLETMPTQETESGHLDEREDREHEEHKHTVIHDDLYHDVKSTYSLRSTMSSTSGLIPRIMENEFNPTPLKMVTSTAVCTLQKEDGSSLEIDFKQFYNDYIAPPVTYYNILTKEYSEEWIGHVVGCKTGSFDPKGRYHPHNVAQFFNSVTLIVSIDKKKEVNVKLFKNGKLQLTGIPSIEAGNRAVGIVLRYIEDTYQIKLRIEQYLGQYDIRTVMLNTCYEVGFPIHREVLYEILVNQYKMVAMYDTEGYPGVRLHYYYNSSNIGTSTEGICQCKPMCKGTGSDSGNCKRISIAIFQSGKIIIAGGCHEMEPILRAYEFLNKLLRESHQNIRKYITTEAKQPSKKRRAIGRSNDVIMQLLHNQLRQGIEQITISSTGSSASISVPTIPKSDRSVSAMPVNVPHKLKWVKLEKSRIQNIELYKTMVMYRTMQLNVVVAK